MREILINILLILLAIELPLFIWILVQIRRLKSRLQTEASPVFEKFASLPPVPGKGDADRQLLEYLARGEGSDGIPTSFVASAGTILGQRKILTGLNILVLVLCALLTAQLYLFN